jgi:hypothetical protein
MGLLDDAIREHLEFKRRGGADPSEVLRLEREAFDPALGVESGEPGETVAPTGHAAGFEELRAARLGHAGGADEVQTAPDLSSRLTQETVEFDMRAALDTEPASTEDSLEWEMPGERRGFSGRPFLEAPAPRRRIVDAPPPEAVEVPAGMPDPPDGASDQASLWRDRRGSPGLDFDFGR